MRTRGAHAESRHGTIRRRQSWRSTTTARIWSRLGAACAAAQWRQRWRSQRRFGDRKRPMTMPSAPATRRPRNGFARARRSAAARAARRSTASIILDARSRISPAACPARLVTSWAVSSVRRTASSAASFALSNVPDMIAHPLCDSYDNTMPLAKWSAERLVAPGDRSLLRVGWTTHVSVHAVSARCPATRSRSRACPLLPRLVRDRTSARRRHQRFERVMGQLQPPIGKGVHAAHDMF